MMPMVLLFVSDVPNGARGLSERKSNIIFVNWELQGMSGTIICSSVTL